MTIDHKLYVGSDFTDVYVRTESERWSVPYRESTKRPLVGDVVEVRSTDRNESYRAVVVSVESDDAVTTTLERQRCPLCDVVLPIFRSLWKAVGSIADRRRGPRQRSSVLRDVCTCGWDPARPDGFPR